ncbi:Uncharacterised protein [Vibrio cholerae]|nr:Uncharacterised protein [Vibrio cholerae]
MPRSRSALPYPCGAFWCGFFSMLLKVLMSCIAGRIEAYTILLINV